MITVRVKDGTGAGSKHRPNPTVKRCACGGFISCARAKRGATTCLRCESSFDRIREAVDVLVALLDGDQKAAEDRARKDYDQIANNLLSQSELRAKWAQRIAVARAERKQFEAQL